MLALFDTHEPTSVFHLGALLSAGAEANPTMGFQTDTVGSWRVFEATRLNRARSRERAMIWDTVIAFAH